MADEVKNIPESEYNRLSPRERFEELEQIYKALPQPAAEEETRVALRKADIFKELANRLMLGKDVTNLEAELEDLKAKGESLKKQTKETEEKRMRSEHRSELLRKLRNLLTTSSAPHTSSYYDLIIETFSNLYVSGVSQDKPMADASKHDLLQKTFLTDPTQTGGIFNPELAQDLERQAFSYEANSVLTFENSWTEFMVELNEMMGRPHDPVMVKTSAEEAKDSPAHLARAERLRTWRREFFEKFGDEPYKKVSY